MLYVTSLSVKVSARHRSSPSRHTSVEKHGYPRQSGSRGEGTASDEAEASSFRQAWFQRKSFSHAPVEDQFVREGPENAGGCIDAHDGQCLEFCPIRRDRQLGQTGEDRWDGRSVTGDAEKCRPPSQSHKDGFGGVLALS